MPVHSGRSAPRRLHRRSRDQGDTFHCRYVYHRPMSSHTQHYRREDHQFYCTLPTCVDGWLEKQRENVHIHVDVQRKNITKLNKDNDITRTGSPLRKFLSTKIHSNIQRTIIFACVCGLRGRKFSWGGGGGGPMHSNLLGYCTL